MKQTEEKESLKATFLERVAALSPRQRKALAQKLSAALESASPSRPTAERPAAEAQPSQRLIAYVVSTAEQVELDPTALRQALKRHLPPYMIPAAIVSLKALPRTANGKIDTRALPDPQPYDPAAKGQLMAPRNPTEATLAQIWQTVLGTNAIGIHDNFFELGGDSILSIQIVSQARDSGLQLAPNQLFEQPTIAALATVVNITQPVLATQAAVVGPLPLTPIQHWFFHQVMAVPQHWHQAILLEIPDAESVSSEAVWFERAKAAIAALWTHHDALRLRFIQNHTNSQNAPSQQLQQTRWQQINADISNPPKPLRITLSSLTPAEQQQAVAKYATELHSRTCLFEGNLLQAAYFSRGHQPSWLLISLHHLAVDGISWQILKDDLRTLLAPTEILSQLPPKTTAFKAWAEALTNQAPSQSHELAFWLNQLRPPYSLLPSDSLLPATATEGAANTIIVKLEGPTTRSLLKEVPTTYGTQINDVLLTALTQTLLHWINKSDSIRIDLEGHGREQVIPDVDLSRTVGWFSTVYPIKLTLGGEQTLGAQIKAIKEQLRGIPNRGIGYGLLRYLGDEMTQQQLSQFPPAQVLFNYLGRRETGQSVSAQHFDKTVRLIEDINLGTLKHPQNKRSYPLEINAWVANDQLHLNWTYDTHTYHPATIPALASTYLKNLEAIISHCLNAEQRGFTPSDFPDVQFSQAELDGFLKQLAHRQLSENIAAIYPLAPLQQSFLWHSLQKSSSAGLLHMRGTLKGELNVLALQQAWTAVVNRHSALRTSIHWDTIPQPVQVVAKQSPLPWQQFDWQTVADRSQKLADFLNCDRKIGFDFTQAPIMRLTLIQLAPQAHELIWSCHHLMLDGWSGTQVITQVLETYEALIQGASLSTIAAPNYQTSYRTYIQWLAQQDNNSAKTYWTSALKGFKTPTPIPIAPGSPTSKSHSLRDNVHQSDVHQSNVHQSDVKPARRVLSVEMTRTVQIFLRSHHLTLNTLIQSTWALLLHRRSRQNDILFGATVSGRQGDLPGIESIVGLLINVLPVRVIISPEQSVLDWLHTLQTGQSIASRHAHVSSNQIQAWHEQCTEKTTTIRRLFNTLLVIENYPSSPSSHLTGTTENNHTLQIENLRSGIISTYGLTFIVKPGKAIALFAEAPNAQPASLKTLLTEFADLLSAIVNGPNATIQQVSEQVELYTPQQPSGTDLFQNTLSSTTVTATAKNTEQSAEARPYSPPQNKQQLQLVHLWESILPTASINPKPLSIDDNFFDLGGDSLLAVQLFDQMQQQISCTLPLATLFQAPTIRQFEALLNQEKPVSSWSSLVPVQLPSANSPSHTHPLFFHGGSADALTWARFARLLGPEQPFYALQRPGLDGSTITPLTVEELAATCITEIKTVQPHGPYIIGGHCFGGAVAFEIARQLQAQGDDIASLIQIDAYCPNARPKSTIRTLQEQLQLNTFRLHKAYYYHTRPTQLRTLPTKIFQKIRSSQQPATIPTPQASPPLFSQNKAPAPAPFPPLSPAPSPIAPSYQTRYAQAHQANIIAADHYFPHQLSPPYTGPLTLFRANVQILSWHYGPDLGWQSLMQNPIKITSIPGLFGNLFNQRSGPLLAQQVKSHLNTIP